MNKKREGGIALIIKKREENEDENIICSREINENIRRIFNNQPLTRPLRSLKNNCIFEKRYKIACDIRDSLKYEKCWNCNNMIKKGKRFCSSKCKDKREKYMTEYRQRPEVKEKQRQKSKKYYDSLSEQDKEKHRKSVKEYNKRPEVKEKRKEYSKKYSQRPEYKEIQRKKGKKYYYKNKEKILEKRKEYNQRPKVKKMRIKNSKKYYYENKEAIKERKRKNNEIPEVKQKRKKYYQNNRIEISIKNKLRYKKSKLSTNHDTNKQTLNTDKPHTDALLQKSDTYISNKNLTNIQAGDTK